MRSSIVMGCLRSCAGRLGQRHPVSELDILNSLATVLAPKIVPVAAFFAAELRPISYEDSRLNRVGRIKQDHFVLRCCTDGPPIAHATASLCLSVYSNGVFLHMPSSGKLPPATAQAKSL